LPIEQVQQRLDAAKGKLTESAGLLGGDGLSWSLSFISGLLILLREGLEAILVLAAILAFRVTPASSRRCAASTSVGAWRCWPVWGPGRWRRM
jgi:high-affinity iron transporter